MTYGEHAMLARVRAGYSKVKLEQAAKVAAPTIRLIEQDKRYPRLKCLLSIVNVLGIGIDEYFGIKPKHQFWDERKGSIAKHIQKVRRRCFVFPEELAKQAGISTVTLYNAESGRTDPTMQTILLISQALNVSPDELVGNPCPDRRYADE